MKKLFSFMVVTLDGFQEGPNGEFDWPNVDDEFKDFSVRQMNDIDTLLFGRLTYDSMAQYWPSPEAIEDSPAIADFMNRIPKAVFSSTLGEATWANTTLVQGDAATAITELKQQPGTKDLAIFGSPKLTASLLGAGVVDEVRVMVHPILLGGGVSLFTGLEDRVKLRHGRTTTFSSGNVLLTYEPVAST